MVPSPTTNGARLSRCLLLGCSFTEIPSWPEDSENWRKLTVKKNSNSWLHHMYKAEQLKYNQQDQTASIKINIYAPNVVLKNTTAQRA